MKIKVCGMRDADNIRQVAAIGVDYIGMIFWEPSPRNVPMISSRAGVLPDRASLKPIEAAAAPRLVGVFVDEMPQSIITRAVSFRLDVLQMHGHESPTLLRNLRATLDPDLRPGIQIWKAISVATEADLSVCKDYEDCVDAFVFDTKGPLAGGNGKQFDWQVLQAYNGSKPFLLSGGIGPDDAQRVRDFSHPHCMGIDLNSRFETAPAMKDIARLKTFISSITDTTKQQEAQ